LTDLRKVEEGLNALFRELHGADTRVVGLEYITVGWETQIVAFDLITPDRKSLDLVARIYPSPGDGRKAEREFNVMYRLDTVGYPVPCVYIYDSGVETLGTPFLVMERIRGSTLWDVFFASPKEKRGEVLATNSLLMAQLHAIPPSKVYPDNIRSHTRHRISERVWDESEKLGKYGLDNTFSPLTKWLLENVNGLSESPLCPIHTDFHPRNVLLRSDGSPAVIDWGTSTVGDFREDLSWTALLSGTFVDDSLRDAVYNSYRKVSGRSLVDLPYFEAYSGLRRLADLAASMKAGAAARGMRPEAIKDMEGNRLHYKKILGVITHVIGIPLPELARLIDA
jgi:aminoglycoside phosphotransferase (APT) family kinase protein